MYFIDFVKLFTSQSFASFTIELTIINIFYHPYSHSFKTILTITKHRQLPFLYIYNIFNEKLV